MTLFILLAGLSVSGCDKSSKSSGQPYQIIEFDGAVMGTTYHIKVVTNYLNRKVLDKLKVGIQNNLDKTDDMMSTYKPSSELSRFNQFPQNKWFQFSPETYYVIRLAQNLAKKTAGKYDITVGPLVNLWGFGPDKMPATIPTKRQLEKIIKDRVGYQFLVLDDKTHSAKKLKPLYVDLSSVAKGYGVDRVASYIKSQGIASYLVEVGGEVKTEGLKPNGKKWHLAIEAPDYKKRAIYSVIELSGHGMATSGDYRNYYVKDGKRFSHTIDPTTGYPVQHKLASASVVMPTTAEADALATAFMVIGTEPAYNYAVKHEIAAFFIYREKGKFKNRYTPEFDKFLKQ